MSKVTQENKRNLRVGVIIPCFNHGKYVLKCLDSVVKQSYKDKCIYISNEGSTDNSKELILSFIKDKQDYTESVIFGKIEDCPIVFFDNPNPKGPSAARNKLFELGGNNDCFSMLDADDYYLPGKLEKTVSVMEQDIERIGIVYNDSIIYNEKLQTKIYEYREPYSYNRLKQECIISNTPLINKNALIECGVYDEEMRTAEDWDLWLRITEKFIAIHIPEALHVYRVTGLNASDVVPLSVWQKNWQKIRERVNARSK